MPACARRGTVGAEGAFREPPACDDKSPSRATGVQALEFPREARPTSSGAGVTPG